MGSTLLIYVTALVVFALAGSAVLLLLRGSDARLGSGALPLGACVLALAAHWPGYLLNAELVAVVVLVAALVGLVAAVVRLRRRSARRALEGIDLVVAGAGGVAGVALLVPLFVIGFPTTLAMGIADGFARSILTEWLLENPLADSRIPVGTDRPAGTYSYLTPELGAGFEYLSAIVATVTRRTGHEVVQVVAATSVPLAVCGWNRLLEELTGRRPRVWQALLLVAPALSPVFVLPYADDYLTHLFSVALWPFAAASLVAFFRAPGVTTAILGAIPVAATAAVYPPLLPWMVPTVLAVAGAAVVVGRAGGWRVALIGTSRSLVMLGVAVVVLAPIPLLRAWEAVTAVGGLRSNAGFPLLRIREAGGILLGGLTQLDLAAAGGTTTTREIVITLAILLGAAVVAAVVAWTLPNARWWLAGLAVPAVGVTVALFWKYKFGDNYGYGGYKAVLFGGAMVVGLMFVAFAGASARWRMPCGLAVGVCLALWLPQSIELLDRQQNGSQGFRAADEALGDQLEKLPRSAGVLAEGAVETPEAFQLRLAAMYFAMEQERTIQGVGTTPSYGTGGGSAAWRPTRPWTHVIAAGPATTFEQRRRVLWSSGPYRLLEAPALDVTPFGRRPTGLAASPTTRLPWLPRAADDPQVVDYVAGPAELVVANRTGSPQTARLTLTMQSMTPGVRTVRLRARGAREELVRVTQQARKPATIDVPVAPGKTAIVALEPGAAGTPQGAPADAPPPPLVAITDLDLDAV